MGNKVMIPREFSGGIKPVKGQCRAEVATRWSGHQCKRKDGYGPHICLCSQHAKQAAENGYEVI